MKLVVAAVLAAVLAGLGLPPLAIGTANAVTTAAIATATDACGAQPVKADGTPWVCTFDDEFTGTGLDRTRWMPQTVFTTGSPTAYACYLDDPSTIAVSRGSLNLTVRTVPKDVSCGAALPTKVVAGMVSTYHLFSQQYGRFEARVRSQATSAPGLQEAFWLWPDDRVPSYTWWPFAGEIDIAETYSVHPDLAITDTITGGPWRDKNGVAWVNPMLRELWTPNIDLAVEAANFGFDEIQYDYIRFPTDGDLTRMDFGAEYTEANREAAVQGFLEQSRERLRPTGARQSADVFGFTMLTSDDIGIGQNFANLATILDYLSPMVYPSHYSDGQFGLPGHPNDFPYEIVDISLRAGIEDRGVNPLQIRPWLQDFDLVGMSTYGEAEVRAQIQAANEHGTSGWMLWDPENRFRRSNLDPEQPSAIPNPENA